MTALSSIVLFFLVLVILYPAVAAASALAGWAQKRRMVRAGPGSGKTAVEIDATVDGLKNRLFILSVAIAFFVIAPVLALWMML